MEFATNGVMDRFSVASLSPGAVSTIRTTKQRKNTE
jgi:anti-sigma regulatory factor (Ser/Thr protein kinase)